MRPRSGERQDTIPQRPHPLLSRQGSKRGFLTREMWFVEVKTKRSDVGDDDNVVGPTDSGSDGGRGSIG